MHSARLRFLICFLLPAIPYAICTALLFEPLTDAGWILFPAALLLVALPSAVGTFRDFLLRARR